MDIGCGCSAIRMRYDQPGIWARAFQLLAWSAAACQPLRDRRNRFGVSAVLWVSGGKIIQRRCAGAINGLFLMRYEHSLTGGLTVSKDMTGSLDIKPTAFTPQKHAEQKSIRVYKTITYIIKAMGASTIRQGLQR